MVDVTLSPYKRRHRANATHSLQQQLYTVQAELFRLQFRYNEMCKALLTIAQVNGDNITLSKTDKNISSAAEREYLDVAFHGDEDLSQPFVEDEIEDLLRCG
jgi:hypothetical protein